MSKRTSFIITKLVRTPFVVDSNLPHKPRQVKYKQFKPGDMITGVLHMTAAGKPDFVLVSKRLVIPATCVRELVTQEVVSNADGKEQMKKFIQKGDSSVKYADAAILGAIIGIAAVWVAEKKQWISMPSPKNKIIGGVVGAGLLAYVVYRIRNQKKKN